MVTWGNPKDSVFEDYTIESAAANVINLEVPLTLLARALRSANHTSVTAAGIRLTKRDGAPMLCLTITCTSVGQTNNGIFSSTSSDMSYGGSVQPEGNDDDDGGEAGEGDDYEAHVHSERGARHSKLRDSRTIDFTNTSRQRTTTITQDIPIRVLASQNVAGIHEPRTREPDVHIQLPPLTQLKSISDRFTKLALSSTTTRLSVAGTPKLELAANMHGVLRLRVLTDTMNLTSTWSGLNNPQLDPAQIEGGLEALKGHPSERMRLLGDREGRSELGWSRVRIDGRDWGKVMSVGRIGGRVIACFCDEHALILYVYLNTAIDDADTSVLTYYMASYGV